MSTNFYLPQTDGPDLHVGKRSAGWKFNFRAQPQARTRTDWERLVKQADAVVTECGHSLTPAQFWAEVDATREPLRGTRPKTRAGMRGQQGVPVDGASDYVDPDGWDFTDGEFS